MQSADMYIIYCRMKFHMPISTGPLASETQNKPKFLHPPSWYCSIYNSFISIQHLGRF